MICGDRFLAALTDESEPRRLLDQVWASNGIKYCLEQGQWHFAMRTVQIDYDTSIQPSYGYNRAFQKPTDWVNTSGVCSDEFFRSPLTRYIDEAGYWYSDLDTIYVRYVSMDAGYGFDLNKWPESFREFVAYFFAAKIINKLQSSEAEEGEIKQEMEKALKLAKSKAAMAEPTSFPAQGSWSSAHRRGSGRSDRGNTGQLIG